MFDSACSVTDRGDATDVDEPPRDRTRAERAAAAVAFLGPAIAELEAVVAQGPADVTWPAADTAATSVALFERTERIARLAAVARVDAIAAVHDAGGHLPHGHASAHAMARHLGRLSSAESARADKIRRMVTRCDLIDAAWRRGDLSVDQAGVLARAFANPRSRPAFVEAQRWFLQVAAKPFRAFEQRVADWVRLHDVDGPEPRPEPAHENRNATMVQDHFSLQWTLGATTGSLQGAQMRRVFDAYISAENLADWESARSVHGDATCREHLARSDAQRRADALAQIFADAAANPHRSAPVDTQHSIVWSQTSFERALRRFFGADPEPRAVDVDEHRCSDLDGNPLDPDAAFADALTSRWRRVVVSARGITLDMSRSQRLFTGLARLGVQINHDHCFWPGCNVPATSCQVDHTRPAARGGRTEQSNGAPCCQKHNRLKERGYTVARRADGTFTITTPSGDTVPT